MRGTRVKKLKAIFKELVSRQMAPPDNQKRHFRFFKKLYLRGELTKIFPTM